MPAHNVHQFHIYRQAFKNTSKKEQRCRIPAVETQWAEVPANAHLEMTPASQHSPGRTASGAAWNVTNAGASAYFAVSVTPFSQTRSCFSARLRNWWFWRARNTTWTTHSTDVLGNIMCKCCGFLRFTTESPWSVTYGKKLSILEYIENQSPHQSKAHAVRAVRGSQTL